ncbi:MAG: hypothetical protein ABIM99_03465 [Candidatus Dojkabacteria bacterium]
MNPYHEGKLERNNYIKQRTQEIVDGEINGMMEDLYSGLEGEISEPILDLDSIPYLVDIVNELRVHSKKGLLVEGLGDDKESQIIQLLMKVISSGSININQFLRTLIIKGSEYYKLDSIMTKSPGTIKEDEMKIIKDSRLSRYDLEIWKIYIYIASLIKHKLLVMEI